MKEKKLNREEERKNSDLPAKETESPEDYKGASDIDIKQRDEEDTEPEEKKEEKLAPSGEFIVNTGADIVNPKGNADAPTG